MLAEQMPAHRLKVVRHKLGASRERTARLLDVSTKTVERWEQKGISSENSAALRKVAILDQIATLGLMVYTPEGFREFLTTPLPRFGLRTALSLIENGEEDLVLGALASDYEGAGY